MGKVKVILNFAYKQYLTFLIPTKSSKVLSNLAKADLNQLHKSCN